MKTEQELRELLADTSKALFKIEEDRKNDANRKYIGKCFKTNNTFSDGVEWPIYMKVLDVVKTVDGFKFQKTSRGQFEAYHYSYMIDVDGWEEITPDEFNRAWEQFLEGIKELNK